MPENQESLAGRPTVYTEDLGDMICECISRKEPLAKICDNNEELPTPRTVYRWLRLHQSFCHNYELAKEDQADFLVDEALQIADDPTIEPADKRIRVDTRKWVASKFKVKRYGDKLQTETTIKFEDMSDDELDSKIKMLLKDA